MSTLKRCDGCGCVEPVDSIGWFMVIEDAGSMARVTGDESFAFGQDFHCIPCLQDALTAHLARLQELLNGHEGHRGTGQADESCSLCRTWDYSTREVSEPT